MMKKIDKLELAILSDVFATVVSWILNSLTQRFVKLNGTIVT